MVLLTAHLLNGQKMGVDIPINSIITEPFKIEETPSAGYADISGIENWWNFGYRLRDYSYVRFQIKRQAIQIGIDSAISTLSDPPVSPADGDRYYINPDPTATGDWTGYEGWLATWNAAGPAWLIEPPEWVGYRLATQAEKDILAQLKIGSQGDHFTDYGVPAIVDYGLEYHIRSREAREARMLRVTVEVYNRLPLNVAEGLVDITSGPLGDMYNRYIEFGVKGTLEDYNVDFNPNPTPGITDYIMGRAPFNNQEPYLSAGYPAGMILKGWSPIDGTTLTDFCNEMYNILIFGQASGIT